MNSDKLFSEFMGIALYTSRRFVEVYYPQDDMTFLGTCGSRNLEVTPGDIVKFTLDKKNNSESNITINSIEPRQNLLKRSYDKKTKLLAANLNSLWIVTAPPPLFNTIAIDRTLAAASIEQIPTHLIANKSDLIEFNDFSSNCKPYSSICEEIHFVSALKKIGLDRILGNITTSSINIIAIAGISGVGKSSLISALFPDFSISSGTVSEKTGQGKQTTSAAKGYVIKGNTDRSLTVLIDLPGIQNYGVSHLTSSEIAQAMPDIYEYAQLCKFRNCQHLSEPSCAVIEALLAGKLMNSRIQSFRDMLNEISKNKGY